MVNYGCACKNFETTPTDLVTVQPFKVVSKLLKVNVHPCFHSSKVREAKLKFCQVSDLHASKLLKAAGSM